MTARNAAVSRASSPGSTVRTSHTTQAVRDAGDDVVVTEAGERSCRVPDLDRDADRGDREPGERPAARRRLRSRSPWRRGSSPATASARTRKVVDAHGRHSPQRDRASRRPRGTRSPPICSSGEGELVGAHRARAADAVRSRRSARVARRRSRLAGRRAACRRRTSRRMRRRRWPGARRARRAATAARVASHGVVSSRRPEPASTATGTPRSATLDDGRGLHEPDHPIVRRVHLQHERGVGAERAARSRRVACGWWCRPRRAGTPTPP